MDKGRSDNANKEELPNSGATRVASFIHEDGGRRR
jgi:hypothetical protein